MHDINGNAGHFSQGDGAMHSFGFGQRGARERVMDGCGFAFGQRLPHDDIDHAAVLGVHANQRAVFRGLLQRAKDGGVVHHQDVRIRHEQLEAGHALAHHVVHVFQAGFGQIGDDHVQAIIDAGLRFRLFPPGVQRVAHPGAARLNGEIDDGGGAADGRRARSSFEIVARGCPAERHVQMRVRVDAAGQQQHARGVQHYMAGLRRDARADFFDDAVFHQYIRGESLVGQHYRAVLYEKSHQQLFPKSCQVWRGR